MEGLQEKLKRIEKLSLDPFKPELLEAELAKLIEQIPNMSVEELQELGLFLEKLKHRVKENHEICFGWMRKVLKDRFNVKA
ncbi:MAG: hypothetical protein NZ531_05865 [Aquificaceae bacterium]|nr:hypothetical protein [Aquificaceae bacterium]